MRHVNISRGGLQACRSNRACCVELILVPIRYPVLAGSRGESGFRLMFESRDRTLDSPNDSLDEVLRTLMMHYLPDDLKQQGLAEVARVLKPNGRLIVVDFNRKQERRSGPL